jgi:threonine aldolase
MQFASDNIVGASAAVLDAIVKANGGAAAAYGADAASSRVAARLAEIFETDVAVFPVTTGTAANALALAAAVPPYGLAFCHAEAHVLQDECGAPEFFMHGAKLLGLADPGGKLRPETIDASLQRLPSGVQQMPPRALSLSQATECGTLYSPDDVAALSHLCRKHGLALHMDGARFANALVALGCSPAEMTWKQGVDILSFGGTKNGCLMAEAVIVFDRSLAESLAYRRKRAGQTISKGRLIAAQFEAYLADDHWLANARHANRMARLMADGLQGLPGVRLAWPVEANEIFPILPVAMDRALHGAGANFRPWSDASLMPGEAVRAGEVLVRLVTSFATREEDVQLFIDVARRAAQPDADGPVRSDPLSRR